MDDGDVDTICRDLRLILNQTLLDVQPITSSKEPRPPRSTTLCRLLTSSDNRIATQLNRLESLLHSIHASSLRHTVASCSTWSW